MSAGNSVSCVLLLSRKLAMNTKFMQMKIRSKSAQILVVHFCKGTLRSFEMTFYQHHDKIPVLNIEKQSIYCWIPYCKEIRVSTGDNSIGRVVEICCAEFLIYLNGLSHPIHPIHAIQINTQAVIFLSSVTVRFISAVWTIISKFNTKASKSSTSFSQ